MLANLLRMLESRGASPALARQLARVPGYQPRQIVFTHDEITAVMTTAKPWLAFIFSVCYSLALRSGDAVNLAPCHYDRDAKMIRNLPTKNGKTISLPVGDPSLQLVMESIGPGDSCVPYAQLIRERQPKPRTGGPKRNQRAAFCAKTAQDAWNDAKKKSGVRPELRMHDFRRTQATDVWRVTKDLLAVKRLLGHESVSTTAGYIQHENAEPLRAIMKDGYSPTRAAADYREATAAGRILTPLETRRTQ